MGNRGTSPSYPTSPISRDESSSSLHWSPLQQFIASCEILEDGFTSSRMPKRRRDGVWRWGFGVDVDSSVVSDRTIVTGRSRANAWDSDVTALDTADDVSSSGKKRKSILELSLLLDLPTTISFIQLSCAPSADLIGGQIDINLDMDAEDDVGMSDAASAVHHALLRSPDLWTVSEGEKRTPISSSAGPSRTKHKPRMTLSPNPNPFTQNRNGEVEEIQFSTGFDVAPLNHRRGRS